MIRGKSLSQVKKWSFDARIAIQWGYVKMSISPQTDKKCVEQNVHSSDNLFPRKYENIEKKSCWKQKILFENPDFLKLQPRSVDNFQLHLHSKCGP